MSPGTSKPPTSIATSSCWVAPAPPGPLDRACTNSTEVLYWYRSLLEDGTRLTVESVEVDGDAVVLGLNVARQARGPVGTARTSLPVFTVSGAQVVEVRFYPDRASALLRPRS